MTTKFWLFILTALVAVLLGVTIATAETHEPTERWEPRFGYKACMSLEAFAPRMEQYGGELLSSGKSGDAVISVMLFPDNSFGIFIYDPVSGFICSISSGWFAEPSTPA